MEKHPHPFDEFLKVTLKGHQLVPREEAKKVFLREADTIITARQGWMKWYYIPILVVIISCITAFLYFRNAGEQVEFANKTAENIITNPNVNDNSNSITSSSSTSVSILNTGNEPVKKIIPTIGKTPVTKNEIKTTDAVKSKFNDIPDGRLPESPVNPVTYDVRDPASPERAVKIQSEKLFPATATSELNPDSLTGSVKPDTDIVDKTWDAFPDTVLSTPSAADPRPKQQTPDKPVSCFSLDAFFMPEWMSNTLDGDKYVSNFGFEGIFHHGRISIRTGAGLSISKGVTKNTIEYNDFLGTYNKLDSIAFTFDESIHDFTTEIYMRSEKVWDSISKLDSNKVIKRYTYLQVPFVIGFDFWQQGRLTIGVRVGTMVSVLLNSKQLTADYNSGENLVLGINRITPDHVSMNWQAIGGLNASVRLTNSIFFEIEPQAKYYYQSIYEKSGINKKPWSVGMRLAVLYRF